MARVLPALFLLLILISSGCTSDTGKTVEQTKLTLYEPKPSQELQPEQSKVDAREDFEEFESNASVENSSVPEETPEPAESMSQCPDSCDDKTCVTSSCSRQTGYKCVYQPITPCCGNSICDEGESHSSCQSDCAAEETACTLQCGACQVLDSSACSCGEKGCEAGDGCCPQGCDFAADSDCPKPDKCSSDSECDDSDSCTSDSCSGQPKDCLHEPIAGCSSGDG